jgi:hypothetical protein
MRNRNVITLLVLAALLLVASCGDDDDDPGATATSVGTEPSRSTSTAPDDDPPPGSVDAELVAFVAGTSAWVEVPAALLSTPEEIAAWIGWFEAADPDQAAGVRDALSERPGAEDSEVLVAFASSGCGEDSARLVLVGSDLDVALLGGDDIDCAEAVGFAVVFAIDDAAVPPAGTLAGVPTPDHVGPGELVLFDDVGATPPPQEDAVVLDAATVDGWTSELVAAGIDVQADVAAVVRALGADERAVAAVVQGCAEVRAEVVIGPGSELAVVLVGPDDVACDALESYVAVLVVAADLLPA